MTNTLAPNENILSPTLPVKDQYGRFDVGGPIGPGDIKNALAGDPQVQFGANMLLDVTPGIESVRSAERLPEQWQAYQNAESPIQQVLRAAEMALEGGALVADVIPHVKALGIGGAALIGLMARRTDEIEGMARFALAKRELGIIGGPKALNANLDALDQAKALKAQGVDADTIYQETRWWLDSPDGVPKFEIDDSGASMGDIRTLPQGERLGPMGSNLEHSELYNAYPDTKRIELFGNEGYGGRYEEGANRIHASNQGVTMHELQHGIQGFEDMAQGGSPDILTGMALPKGWRSRGQESANLAVKIKKWRASSPDVLAKEMSRHDPQVQKMAEMLAKKHDVEQLRVLSGSADYEAYRRLAGESEARLVQDRMNMTMDERLADPFYKNFDVPLEDQIVRRDGGTALSRNGESVLPMDEASRMARAKEMGNTTEAYTGTTHADITEFDGSIAHPESDWGKGTYASTSIDDVNANYAGEGPDLTSRITIRAEQIKDEAAFHDPALKKEFEDIAGVKWDEMDYDTRLDAGKVLARRELKGASEGVVYPINLNTSKYVQIGGDEPTKLVDDYDWYEMAKDDVDIDDFADEFDYEDALRERQYELMESDGDSLQNRLYNAFQDTDAFDQDEAAMQTVMQEAMDMAADGEIDLTQLDDIIRSNVPHIEGNAGEALGGGHTSAQVFKNLGYEGVVDNTVDAKFGSSRQFGQQMEGVYPDTQHIITFPDYEHRIRGKYATYDPKKWRSKNILAGVGAGALGINALLDERDEYVTRR